MITKEKLQRIVASYVDSPMLADELWHSIKTAQQQEPVEVKQIAEALRQVGLTLVRTNGGFRVMDLGRIEAQTTSPPASKPLTDEQILAMCKNQWLFETVRQWVRIIESVHGIKGDA